MYTISTPLKVLSIFLPKSFSLFAHTYNAVFTKVQLTDPSYSPSTRFCSKLFPSIRNAMRQIFCVPTSVIVYIHLQKIVFATALFTKP